MKANGSITEETRRKSFNELFPDISKRQKKIIKILRIYGECTASDIAGIMYLDGLVPFPARNFAQPRLTELCNLGFVEAFKKKRDFVTGRTVAVYRLKEEVK